MPSHPVSPRKSYWPEIEKLTRAGGLSFALFAVLHQGVWRDLSPQGEATLAESLRWTLGKPLWLISYAAGLCAICVQTGVAMYAILQPRAWARSVAIGIGLLLWLVCLYELSYFATGKAWF